MDILYFLKTKFEENQLDCIVKTEDLYADISNDYLKHLFANMHQQFNSLYKFMYSKMKSNRHFNASESRELMQWIKLYDDMEYVLKRTPLSFRMNENYTRITKFCSGFLKESNGSDIPNDLPEIELLEYEPIFFMSQVVTVVSPKQTSNFQLDLIGKGSYAHVFKYRDEFYKKDFVIKRANKDLDEKELIRFRQEFEVMKELKSPYVLDVYRFDEDKNEYYMEYADETLKKFIEKNNSNLSVGRRRGIAYQIFKGFDYVHSKGYLHRDISFTNILLQHYEDLSVIKISDFGLVKTKQSDLTSFGSEIKGSLNDSNLEFIGFKNYKIEYETFALTRLIYCLMTGRYNLDNIKIQGVKDFVLRGINQDVSQRYHSIAEMKEAFEVAFYVL